jgi:protein SCO1/2
MKLLPLLLASLLLSGAALAEAPCCKALAPNATYSDKSLYQLDSTWTSDMDKQVKLGVLRGRPQVVAMFFAQCEYACPILTSHIKHLEAGLPEALRGKVDFLLVSFDTERDTPEALRAYRKQQKLPEQHWTLLTGSTDDVRELASLLGINYAKETRGQFAHSNVITLINAQGEIVYQHLGLTNGTAALIQKLEALPPVDGVAQK